MNPITDASHETGSRRSIGAFEEVRKNFFAKAQSSIGAQLKKNE
jgi:hypothetical protein